MSVSVRRPVPVRTAPRRQRGVALLVALVLLAVMMVTGSNVMETAVVEYKVGAAMRNRAATFEGTEAAAIQSFARLRQLISQGVGSCDNSTGRYEGGRLPGAPGTTANGADAASTRFWTEYGVPSGNAISTALPAGITNVAQARYLMECLPVDDEGEPAGPATYPLQYNRLTVFGGSDASAEVLLQSTLVTLPK